MNRDKQIEEMARTMCQCSHACIMCPYQSPCRCLTNAELLYEKGYREAIVVVRDIFNDLNEMWHKGRGVIKYSDLVRLERLHEQKYAGSEKDDEQR